MYNKKAVYLNGLIKLFENATKEREETEKGLQPFLEIAKNENLTAEEKIKAIYQKTQEPKAGSSWQTNCFIYGKERNIKGGDRIFYITPIVGKPKEFERLEKENIYYNITKNIIQHF